MIRLTILFAFLILALIVLADLGKLGPLHVVYDFPYGDKVGHFILYGILALLVDLTLFRSLPRQDPRLIAIVCGLILALLIGLEEFSQKHFSRRTFDLLDLTASYLGVASFSWVALRVRRMV